MEEKFEEMLKVSVCKMVQEELENCPSICKLKREYHLSEEFYNKMEKLIQYMKKKEYIRKQRLKMILCVACMILLVIWWHPNALVKAKEIIWKWFDTYISFNFEHRKQVMQEYQMTVLPDEYEIIFQNIDDNIGTIVLQNADQDIIELIYTFTEDWVTIDNKEKELTTYYDNETPIYYLKSTIGEENILIWQDEDNDVVFTLFSTLPYEEMNNIYQGIRPADK